MAAFAITVLGALIRIVTVRQTWISTDEPASLLAAQMVWEKGYPLLPSGVLYLQGAVSSYLAAPLAAVGDPDQFFAGYRIIAFVFGLSVIPLSMILARQVSGSTAAAVLNGFLVACDPMTLKWDLTIRPYGLLMVVTIAIVSLAVKLVSEGSGSRFLKLPVQAWLVALLWVGTYTHIGIWLVVPGIALYVLISRWQARSGVLALEIACGFLALLAPLSFLLLGRVVGIGNGTSGSSGSNLFLGNHLFDARQIVESATITWSTWTGAFEDGQLLETIPFLIAISSGLLLFRGLATRDARTASIELLLCAHWSIVLIVCIFVVVSPQSRYLLHAVPLGYVLIGSGVVALWRAAGDQTGSARVLVRSLVVLVLVVPSIINAVGGARWRMETPVLSADYWMASRYVSERLVEGEGVLTALPPAAYFWLPSSVMRDDAYFLAGDPANDDRANRYIKTLANGERGDFWLGLPTIQSAAELCDVLEAYAGSGWVVIDRSRLSWTFRGTMGDVIKGTTHVTGTFPDNSYAMQILPWDEWDPQLTSVCNVG